MNIKGDNKNSHKYLKLKNILLKEIDTHFKAGDKFYTQRDIIKRYKLGYSTVEKALNQLVQEGVLERKRGSGTFIAIPALTSVNNIGLLIYHFDNPFYSKIIKAAEQEARKHNYHLIVCSTLDSPELEKKAFFELIEAQKVGGFIICPQDKRLNSEIFSLIRARNFPCVLFPAIDTHKAVLMDYVIIDERKGAYLATKHLLEKGCRNIAFVSKDDEQEALTANRLQGYLDALKEYNLPFNRELWLKGNNLEKEGGEKAADNLLSLKTRPDGVFAMSDLMAIGLICRLKEHGLKIPEDLKIVGFDDLEMAAWKEFDLTTIRQPRELIGSKAIDMVIKRCKGENVIDNHIILEPELIQRSSA